MTGSRPAYLDAFESGLLTQRAADAVRALGNCRLCPRKCGVDRLKGEKGVCQTGRRAVVASFNPHYGEEAPLVGTKGSGTIFFSHCNLLCLFCQNFEISHFGEGEPASPEQLASIMIHLQEKGCHNINLVTPSHVVPQILEALVIAAREGLRAPLVFNTGSYDRVSTLKRLDGIVDIYMPDFKFSSSRVARQTCQAPDYPETAKRALLEMHRQVGDLKIGEENLAVRGLLVRHLVMPGGTDETGEIMTFIAREISTGTYVNIMPQYRPCGRGKEMPPLDRLPTPKEFAEAMDAATKAGLTRLDRPRRRFILM